MATARQLQSRLGHWSPSTLMSLSPNPESSRHECPLVRCVNPLSQPPYPFLPAAQRRSPRGTRGTAAEPRGSLPSASAGVKWAQRKPRDARESASVRRGACAPIAGAVPPIRVERLPVSQGSPEDQLALAAQHRRLLEERKLRQLPQPETPGPIGMARLFGPLPVEDDPAAGDSGKSAPYRGWGSFAGRVSADLQPLGCGPGRDRLKGPESHQSFPAQETLAIRGEGQCMEYVTI